MLDSQQLIPVICIDGPTGSGKGTVSRLLSERLGWHFLDSGAIYRVFALASLKQHVPADDPAALAALASTLDIQFIPEANGECQVLLGHDDVSEVIRQERVGNQASKTSQYREVRQALMDCQRAFRRFPGLVADGRDMGTVVFPDAPVKVFLSASAEERAKRRFLQLQQKGMEADYEVILAELMERDERDRKRAVAPLRAAEDALLLDSTNLSAEQVVNMILQYAEKKLGKV